MTKKTAIKKIFLLEDEQALASLYMSKLADAGFEVKLFDEVDKLIEASKSFKADVAFLDQSLHGAKKSGLDVIPSLKECNPKMQIVILSNYSEFQMEKAAKKAGADDYLLKINTSPNALVDYVKKL